ncbi:MAG TPA: SCP2 sterol-binding domain-containing protein [Gaiellaceae bacterium]|nr:SCP2 sterol-binding domain-containing protein [Gaiellaceae bacterium]
MATESAREFFDTLEARASNSTKAAGLNASYLFDIDGAGEWTVRVENGKVSVQEGAGEADTTISASEDTFVKIINGQQNPTSAFMMGKLKVSGDLGNAMKLQQLF